MATVTLPHGFAADGGWQRNAELRPVGEQDLWNSAPGTGAGAVNAFLTRCLTRLGPYAPPTEAQVAALTVGDREALLIHLRRITLGDRLDCVLTCAGCGARMDLPLQAGELLLPPYADGRVWHSVDDDGVPLQLRAPTGADLAAVASVAAVDEEGAAEVLLRRCLGEVPPGFDLTADRVERLSEQLQQIDPQAELLLDFTCPECGAAGQASLDMAAYLMREVAARQEALLREIHSLALHYHWSEAEILAVAPARRRFYLWMLGLADDGEGLR